MKREGLRGKEKGNRRKEKRGERLELDLLGSQRTALLRSSRADRAVLLSSKKKTSLLNMVSCCLKVQHQINVLYSIYTQL